MKHSNNFTFYLNFILKHHVLTTCYISIFRQIEAYSGACILKSYVFAVTGSSQINTPTHPPTHPSSPAWWQKQTVFFKCYLFNVKPSVLKLIVIYLQHKNWEINACVSNML